MNDPDNPAVLLAAFMVSAVFILLVLWLVVLSIICCSVAINKTSQQPQTQETDCGG